MDLTGHQVQNCDVIELLTDFVASIKTDTAPRLTTDQLIALSPAPPREPDAGKSRAPDAVEPRAAAIPGVVCPWTT